MISFVWKHKAGYIPQSGTATSSQLDLPRLEDAESQRQENLRGRQPVLRPSKGIQVAMKARDACKSMTSRGLSNFWVGICYRRTWKFSYLGDESTL
jgi:hypothetical protein